MKSRLFGILYSVLLTGFTVFVLLDAFVIERVYTVVEDSSVMSDITDTAEESKTPSASYADPSSVDTDSGYYSDGNITVKLTEYRVEDTTVYVADVVLSDPALLKTAFAENKYGKNIKEKTSEIAESKNAVLAVNGDYYSARSGCVLRNGTLYRDFSGDDEQEALIINADGSFTFVYEDEADGDELVKNGALQVLSFGPALIKSGNISVGVNDEVDKAMRSNPRTAIAWYGDLHYAFVVSDGRTRESTGLSLYELAEFLQDLGVKAAYNLDGGGSSTMYFQGEVVNNPTTNGNRISEREVSDIVYIGY